MSKDATKIQWNSFGWIFGVIFITAVVILLETELKVPKTYWWITGIIGGVITGYFIVRFVKRTFLSRRHNDGGSSVK